ncbi:MAG: SH3 domain-containing protein [Chloroflexi bacterium]|nr:SH3 domain-containing protein [Chloroflexota bacterium]
MEGDDEVSGGYEHNGMTCALIDRAGTVVLLRVPMTFDQPIVPAHHAPAEASSIPFDNCLVKLLETLFLRAAPGGEIIGLVGLNSEGPVFETNGDWYKVEFEGKTGYISRFYRKVLRGNCD